MSKEFLRIYWRAFDSHQTRQIQQILFLCHKTFQIVGHKHQA